jgi:hypothetical protein
VLPQETWKAYKRDRYGKRHEKRDVEGTVPKPGQDRDDKEHAQLAPDQQDQCILRNCPSVEPSCHHTIMPGAPGVMEGSACDPLTPRTWDQAFPQASLIPLGKWRVYRHGLSGCLHDGRSQAVRRTCFIPHRGRPGACSLETGADPHQSGEPLRWRAQGGSGIDSG